MRRNGVLLLGGTGFIGSALAVRLQREGIPVRVVGRDNLQQLTPWLTDCSTVIHLASTTTPGSSAAQPALERANLDLTRHLVQCLRGFPGTHLIYFSSGGAVYGNPAQLPVEEDAPRVPLSPYGVAKVAQEEMCQQLLAHGHSAVTILRPSNAYGPGQTAKSGFGLVRTLMDHARLGTTMEVWGDGNNVRDFIYIDDLVDATMRLVHRPQDAGIYNLGSGVGHSVNQVRLLVEQITGLQIHVDHHPVRATDVRVVVLNSRRLFDQLAWRPAIELTQGLELNWLQIPNKQIS
jgi:UDP-glucose 4-epimerase